MSTINRWGKRTWQQETYGSRRNSDEGPRLFSKNNNTTWDFERIISENNLYRNVDEVMELCKDININKSSCIENLSAEMIRDF